MGGKATGPGGVHGWMERVLPGLITTSAVFMVVLLLLLSTLAHSILHITLLLFSTFVVVLGIFQLTRRWSVFASLEARETSLFVVGALVLFLTPLRLSRPLEGAADLGSWYMMMWILTGVIFVALAAAMLARKAGFFGPWLIGMSSVAVVAWHNGISLGVHYSFRDQLYLFLSLMFVLIGASLHLYSTYLRRQVAAAITLRRRGEYHSSLRIYDAALMINPRDEVVWNNRGNVLADMKRYDEAMECYQTALRINPFYTVAASNLDHVSRWTRNAPDKRHGYRTVGHGQFSRLWRTRLIYQSGWFLGALLAAGVLIQVNAPGGGEYVMLGARVETNLLIDMVIVLVMGFFGLNRMVRTLILKGTLARLKGNLKLALWHYNLALRLNPFNDITWNNQGNVLARMGRYDEALACYDKALKLFPEQPAARKNTALIEKGRMGNMWNRFFFYRHFRAVLRR